MTEVDAKRLEESLVAAARRLDAAAATCDAWARESRSGGWSTHQVKSNLMMANDLRRTASESRAALSAWRGEGGGDE